MRLDNPGKEIFPTTSRVGDQEDPRGTVSLGTFLNMPRIDTHGYVGDREIGAWKDGVDLSPRKAVLKPSEVEAATFHEEFTRRQSQKRDEKAMHREYNA